MKFRRYIFLVILLLACSPLVINKVFGQANSSINVSVKISVCGNGIVEGGEDCDGTNLNNETCSSLGYKGGKLSCDISCSYDTSACGPAHTSKPMSTPAPASINIPTPTIFTTANNSHPTAIPAPTKKQPTTSPEPISIAITNTPTRIKSNVPQKLQKIFDTNKDGKITFSDLQKKLFIWVNAWKQTNSTKTSINSSVFQTCDLNKDNVCGLRDFSYLMYYSTQ